MPARADYEVVGYRPDLRGQLYALQQHLWGQELDPSVWADYLDWKYSRNPYVDTPLIYAVIRAGEVVGMRGLWGSKWSAGQPARELVGLCGGDLVIAPDHRNQGVFPALTRAALRDAAERGHRYIFNFNPGPLTALGLGAMGWRVLGSPEAMVRESGYGEAWERGPARRAWQYAKRWAPARRAGYWVKERVTSGLRRAGHPFSRVDDHRVTRSGSRSHRITVSAAVESGAMADLVERAGSDGRIRHVRDREFFDWRFANPLSRYRFLYSGETGRLDGYLVLQASALPGRRGINIVDWEATRGEVREQLLRAAIECAGFEDVTVWSATATEETRALLREVGFMRPPERPGVAADNRRILIRAVRDDVLKDDWRLGGRRLLDLADWNLRMIDSDAH